MVYIAIPVSLERAFSSAVMVVDPPILMMVRRVLQESACLKRSFTLLSWHTTTGMPPGEGERERKEREREGGGERERVYKS